MMTHPINIVDRLFMAVIIYILSKINELAAGASYTNPPRPKTACGFIQTFSLLFRKNRNRNRNQI